MPHRCVHVNAASVDVWVGVGGNDWLWVGVEEGGVCCRVSVEGPRDDRFSNSSEQILGGTRCCMQISL